MKKPVLLTFALVAAVALLTKAQNSSAVPPPLPTARGLSVDPDNQLPFPSIRNPSTNIGKFTNISTRGFVSVDEGPLVAGFVVTEQERYTLIRAVGPSLAAFGITNYLRKPQITLYDSNGKAIISIGSWTSSLSRDDRSGVAALAREVIAFPLLNLSDDAILHQKLAPGAYTVVITSTDGQSGVALVEVYASPTYVMVGGAGN